MFSILLLLLFSLCTLFSPLPVSVSVNAAFPDCQKGPLSNFPICDPTLDPITRATDLVVHRLNLTERILRLGYDQNGFPHLGLPEWNFGHEALHGVASGTGFTQSGNWSSSTIFPTPINTAAIEIYLLI